MDDWFDEKEEEVKLTKKDVKRGVSSLVDKCRELKAQEQMKEKRHEKYLDFTTQTTIRRDIINNIISADTIAMNQKKQKLKDRKDPKNILFKNRKPKKKSTSVFTDEDFAKVANGSEPNKLMQGFERVR